MKRFLSWTFVVLSLCAGFASCSDDDDEVIPELIVNTPAIAVAGTGGTFEVPILTSGLAQDETVVITANVDWVSNLQATNDKFSFEVSKSPLDVDSRTAIFSLSLSKHASIKATCTLTQGKNHENFYIQMDELRGNSAIYTVTPALSQSEGNFISYCFNSDEFAQYKSATEVKDAIWAKQLATAEEIAEKYGKYYIPTSLSYRSRKGSESTQELVRDLEPGKEYTIVAFGYKGKAYNTAEKMEVTTDLVTYTFITPDNVPEVTPTTLDVKVNVHGALYDVDITAGSSDAYIYPHSSKKSLFESRYPTDEVFVIDRMFYYYVGANYEKILSVMYKQQYQKTYYSIKNNTEGIACAAAFDSHLNLLCSPTKTTFTVGEPEPSDIELTFSLEIKARRALITVKGNKNDPFRMLLMDEEDIEAFMSEGQTEEEKEKLLAKYVQENGLKGQNGFNALFGIWPTHKYVALAVGVAGYDTDEVPTTKVFKYNFTSPEATISTATCAFDIVKCFDSIEFGEMFDSYGRIGYRTTAFTFTQSDDAAEIYYDYDYLNEFLKVQNDFEEMGISDRFEDWQYMSIEVGYKYNRMATILSKGDQDLIIYAAAKDKEGHLGPISQFIIECDKMPISPISDISAFNPNGGAETKSIQLPQWAIKNDIKQSEAQNAGTTTRGRRCIRIK